MNAPDTLVELGWNEHFDRQVTGSVLVTTPPARIADVHRSRLLAVGGDGDLELLSPRAADLESADVKSADSKSADLESANLPTVGDWVLTDPATGRVVRLLERTGCLRRAVGQGHTSQAIAANVDTLGIVTSCDADFNVARLERYLALAHTGDALPLVVLTKADLADETADFRRQAERLSPLVSVVDLDARSESDLERLAPWVGPGRTLALVGSSGVGKSTLLNGLTGAGSATGDVRIGDGKGRHTTTARSLRRATAGGWVIDTPGMRELALSESADGIDTAFAELTTLFAECRFADCRHEAEPGCAVREAIERGELDEDRLRRWRKLRREDEHHSASVAEARERDREFGRRVRSAIGAKRTRRGDD